MKEELIQPNLIDRIREAIVVSDPSLKENINYDIVHHLATDKFFIVCDKKYEELFFTKFSDRLNSSSKKINYKFIFDE